jgi:hypothetical protein
MRVPVDLSRHSKISSHDFSPHNGEAQMPGRRLEGAQSVERWQSVGHFPDDLYMSFCHVKRLEVSFVEGSDSGDISTKRLSLGDKNVHLHA